MCWDLGHFIKLETFLSWKEELEFYVPKFDLFHSISDNLFLYTVKN